MSASAASASAAPSPPPSPVRPPAPPSRILQFWQLRRDAEGVPRLFGRIDSPASDPHPRVPTGRAALTSRVVWMNSRVGAALTASGRWYALGERNPDQRGPKHICIGEGLETSAGAPSALPAVPEA